MTIKIYSTPTCPYCLQAKNFFEQKNLDFEEIDVSQNPNASEEMLKISGQMGVPVIVMDKEVIIGFDEGKINKILNPSE